MKKILTLTIAGVMALSMVACGGSSKESTTETTMEDSSAQDESTSMEDSSSVEESSSMDESQSDTTVEDTSAN